MMDSQCQVPLEDGMSDLQGKVVLVTGGAGGLGKAFVRTMLEKGCKVCMTDINTENGNKALEELSADFGADRICFCVCDVTKDESFKGAFTSCIDAYGGIDILINNAGVGNETNWKLTIDINLGGTIRGTELALEHMSKAKGHKGGHVINISSISGLKDLPFGPFYATTKSAIVHYTRTAGHPFHFGYSGVNISCLCPSLIDTPLLTADTPPYNAQSGAAVKKLFGSMPLMKPEDASAAILQLLKDSKPGSVMVLEYQKAPYYCPPSIAAMPPKAS